MLFVGAFPKVSIPILISSATEKAVMGVCIGFFGRVAPNAICIYILDFAVRLIIDIKILNGFAVGNIFAIGELIGNSCGLIVLVVDC